MNMKPYRIVCGCGNVEEFEGAKPPEFNPLIWVTLGFKLVDGAWTCWKCLGASPPLVVLDDAHVREIGELGTERREDQSDALDFFRRLNDPKRGGGPR